MEESEMKGNKRDYREDTCEFCGSKEHKSKEHKHKEHKKEAIKKTMEKHKK